VHRSTALRKDSTRLTRLHSSGASASGLTFLKVVEQKQAAYYLVVGLPLVDNDADGQVGWSQIGDGIPEQDRMEGMSSAVGPPARALNASLEESGERLTANGGNGRLNVPDIQGRKRGNSCRHLKSESSLSLLLKIQVRHLKIEAAEKASSITKASCVTRIDAEHGLPML
jgi:hypothetical protein